MNWDKYLSRYRKQGNSCPVSAVTARPSSLYSYIPQVFATESLNNFIRLDLEGFRISSKSLCLPCSVFAFH